MAKFTTSQATGQVDHVFIRFDGELSTTAEVVQDITRGFVNGVALKKLGVRGKPESVVGVRDVKNADLQTTLDGYKGLAGQIVTMVDNAGLTHTNIGVLRVPRAKVVKIETPSGGIENGLGEWLVFQPFVIVDASVS